MNDEQVMHAMSIDDMYHVERVLAHGKDGVTELVTVEGSGPFVRKKIPNELARRGVWSALADCDCARLPQVEATYKLPDEFVVVYDFVPGETLEALVRKAGRLDATQAASLALDICEAAAALHAQGIVHRDITPKNVVVSGDGAHLIDLGIARMYAEGATRDTNALGTWGFAAPEQYGFKQTDARSDVYSIGCVLGYLLTGVMPDEDAYHEALADEAVVPARLRAIVDRATDMEPSARYQTAADLAAALRGEKDVGLEVDAGVGVAAGGRAVGDGIPAPAGAPARGRAAFFQRFGRSGGRKRIKSDGAPGIVGWLDSWVSRRMRYRALLFLAMLGFALLMIAISIFMAGRSGGGSTAGSAARWESGSAGSSASAMTPAAGDFDGSLEIGQVGWHAEVGYITVTYSLTNTSADQLVSGCTVTLTARGDDGSVLGVGKDHPMYVFPGQTIWGSAVVAEGSRAGSVEAVPSAVDAGDLSVASASDASTFQVKDAKVKWAAGGMEALGEVVCQKRGRLAQGSIKVIVVFKGAGGSVVGSLETNVDYPAQDGGSVPFDIMAVYVPDYDSYEVCVYDD